MITLGKISIDIWGYLRYKKCYRHYWSIYRCSKAGHLLLPFNWGWLSRSLYQYYEIWPQWYRWRTKKRCGGL